MRQAPIRKQKIELSDYNYHRDIANRLLMAQLTTFEVDVLREILNASLKFHLSELAEGLDVDEVLLMPVLKKFSQIGLVTLKDKTIVVDKEMRKYYEAQIVKFDDGFEPGMEFLQGLLSKIPIHHLPSWYAISRISDHIFQSIIEKYLLTARLYERYLQELEFDDPILSKIMEDVFEAPDFKVPSHVLINKHGLSHEEFEEKMLLLEYSIACCITYERLDDRWVEVVTPFHEWRQYLLFLRNTCPKTITDTHLIERFHVSDFGFTDDLNALLQALPLEAIACEGSEDAANTEDAAYLIPSETVRRILPHAIVNPPSENYVRRLISKARLLELVDISEGCLNLSARGSEWLLQCKQDQAHLVYCLPSYAEENFAPFGDRDLRELEKSLRLVAKAGWIELDAFVLHITAQIGKTEQVTLKNKGKRWRYALPSYSQEEKDFIRILLCSKFFDCGMVTVGTFHGKLCFCVTPFGRVLLEN